MTVQLLLALLLTTPDLPQESPEPPLLAPVAAPDETAAARAHFDAGRALYEIGHFEEALVEFEAAYAAKPLPKLLFNIGQCHFQEKRYARATFFYERYLELSPAAENRQVIEGLIAEARRLDAEAIVTAQAPTPTAEAPTLIAAEAPATTTTQVPSTTADEVPDGSALWLALGIGAAATVAAAVTGAIALAVWSTPPPPGSLGLVDRRTP